MGRFWVGLMGIVALGAAAWGEEFTKNRPYWNVPRAQTVRGHSQPAASSPEVVEFSESYALKGLAIVQDTGGLHWAKVEYAPGKTCFVRADDKHLRDGYDEPAGRPDQNGDYSTRSGHRYWEVVDSGPGGLNGRMHPNFSQQDPKDYPEAVGSWPVVCSFPQGAILKAMTGMRGVRTVRDDQKKDWLIVFQPKRGYCAVRFNSAYVRPVSGPYRMLNP